MPLFLLNKFIVVSFLSEWLASKEVFQLFAACNRQELCKLFDYYETYSSQLVLWKSQEYLLLVSGCLEWLRKQKLLNRLDAIIMSSKLQKKLLPKQNDVYRVVKRAKFFSYSDSTFDSVVMLAPRFTNLWCIELSNVSGQLDVLIQKLSESCRQLTTIEIRNCGKCEKLPLLCRSNPHLRSLAVDMTVEARFFLCLIVHCRQIEVVKVLFYGNRQHSVCPFLLHSTSLTSFQSITSEYTLLLAYHGCRLTHFSLPEYLRWKDGPLSERCPRLTEIVCQDFTMPLDIVNHMPASCTSINFRRYEADDDALYDLGRACPLVTKLCICTASCHVACSAFPCLRELSIVQYRSSLLIPALHSMVWKLDTLNISFGQAYNHTDFCDVLRQCHLLTHLNVAVGSHMEIINAVTEYAAEKLSYLKLYFVHTRGSGINELIKKCTNLTSLLYLHSHIDESTFLHIASHCRKLRHLDVSGSQFVYLHLKKCVAKLPRLLELMTSLEEQKQAILDKVVLDTV